MRLANASQLDGEPLTKNVPANLTAQQRNECIIELVAESPDGEVDCPAPLTRPLGSNRATPSSPYRP